MRRFIYQTLGLCCLVVLLQMTANAQPPGWTVNPSNFANSMSITAQVYIDYTEANEADNWIAAFAGSEIRGVQQAQVINGTAYFFLTIHSNVTSNEKIEFKAYHAANDAIMPALEEIDFLKNSNIGGFPNGFGINVSSTNDFPISLLTRMPDSTLTAYPFQAIELDSMLVTQDNDPVNWTVTNGADISASINSDNVLTLTPNDPAWTGADSVEITATEVGTPNEYNASQYLYFTIEEDYTDPTFGNLPLQFIQPALPPPNGDLLEYLNHESPCLNYSYELLLPLGDQPTPNWVQPPSNSGSMNLVVEVSFGGIPFTGPSHRLAGYVDGEMVGFADPQATQGKVLYFLTLSNLGTGEIIFRFYDSDHFYLYEKPSGISFEAAGSVGNIFDPFGLDLAPISINLSSNGEWSSTVIEPNWIGHQQVRFFAQDCKYLDKVDSTDVLFAFNQCSEQKVSLPNNNGLCFQADSLINEVKWYKDGSQIETGHFLSTNQEGIYHFEGLTPNDCPNIKSCPLLVTNISGHPIPNGTSQPFPPIWPSPPYCGPISYTDIDIDDTPPTAICQNHTVELDINGTAGLQIADVDNGSFTSCGDATLSISSNSFTCSDVGGNQIVLTILDAAGRVDSCTATITVEDNILPTLECKDSIFQVSADGSLAVLPSDVLQSSNDNCGTVTLVGLSSDVFDCGQRGNHTITLTVEDSNGNTNTCNSVITVDDSIFPCCPPTNIVYVNENTDDDDDGSDWNNAFVSLDRALELASRCPIVTEIWVAKGTYFPTSGTDRTVSFELQNDLAIYGGFTGSESSFSERDYVLNETILSGDIGIPNDHTDNSYHVVANIGSGINNTALLEGFTIRHGHADGASNNGKGGGIINRNTSPTIRHCVLFNNFATEQGGGIFNFIASPNVDSCTFKSNASETGGAVYNSNCPNGSFTGCSFKENSATVSGGAMLNINSNFSVMNSHFIGNSTSVDGGAIANISSSPSFVNSVFTLNVAEDGAAFFNLSGSSPLITNCTFFANTANPSSGAIRNNTGTQPTLSNCILWGNGREIVDNSPGAVVSYSIVEGGFAGTGNLDENPLFVDSTDLRITPCSPAVDAGINSTNLTLSDLGGHDRIFNANGASIIDMGAFELSIDLSLPCIWTGNGDGSLWSDPYNWTDLFTPQKCRDVMIPSTNSVTVPSEYEAFGRVLKVELGAELITEPTGKVDIGN